MVPQAWPDAVFSLQQLPLRLITENREGINTLEHPMAARDSGSVALPHSPRWGGAQRTGETSAIASMVKPTSATATVLQRKRASMAHIQRPFTQR